MTHSNLRRRRVRSMTRGTTPYTEIRDTADLNPTWKTPESVPTVDLLRTDSGTPELTLRKKARQQTRLQQTQIKRLP